MSIEMKTTNLSAHVTKALHEYTKTISNLNNQYTLFKMFTEDCKKVADDFYNRKFNVADDKLWEMVDPKISTYQQFQDLMMGAAKSIQAFDQFTALCKVPSLDAATLEFMYSAGVNKLETDAITDIVPKIESQLKILGDRVKTLHKEFSEDLKTLQKTMGIICHSVLYKLNQISYFTSYDTALAQSIESRLSPKLQAAENVNEKLAESPKKPKAPISPLPTRLELLLLKKQLEKLEGLSKEESENNPQSLASSKPSYSKMCESKSA